MTNILSAFDWLLRMHEACFFQTKERNLVGVASKSELRRWVQNGALHINGARVCLEDSIVISEIESAVLFPKSKLSRITLW